MSSHDNKIYQNLRHVFVIHSPKCLYNSYHFGKKSNTLYRLSQCKSYTVIFDIHHLRYTHICYQVERDIFFLKYYFSMSHVFHLYIYFYLFLEKRHIIFFHSRHHNLENKTIKKPLSYIYCGNLFQKLYEMFSNYSKFKQSSKWVCV